MIQKKDNRCNIYVEKDSCERMGSQGHENRSSLGHKFAVMKIVTVLKVRSNLCFKTIPFLGSES